MRMEEASKIMNKKVNTGYMVSFERKVGRMLESGCFPDKENGESLIKTEKEAWALAVKFASRTKGEYVNIHVVKSDFTPVDGYKSKLIKNR